ncbi:hypothetical protein [Jiella sp. M17.18]|uniref:hypothetical protein n=1 Tax=Jiella sp. M17.18 TaxID=3234247 RepID=UPI0034DE4789
MTVGPDHAAGGDRSPAPDADRDGVPRSDKATPVLLFLACSLAIAALALTGFDAYRWMTTKGPAVKDAAAPALTTTIKPVTDDQPPAVTLVPAGDAADKG